MSIKKDKYYSVSAEVARLSGIISARYRTKEGRFILSDRDLMKAVLRMTPEEFIGGVDAISITESEAHRLISKNNYQMGENYVTTATDEQSAQSSNEEQLESSEPADDSTEEETTETAEETAEVVTGEDTEETTNETEE